MDAGMDIICASLFIPFLLCVCLGLGFDGMVGIMYVSGFGIGTCWGFSGPFFLGSDPMAGEQTQLYFGDGEKNVMCIAAAAWDIEFGGKWCRDACICVHAFVSGEGFFVFWGCSRGKVEGFCVVGRGWVWRFCRSWRLLCEGWQKRPWKTGKRGRGNWENTVGHVRRS